MCAEIHCLRVTGNLPLHLCSIIWIETVSYSKWTAVTMHFLAPEAGAYIMKHIPFQCFLYSSLHISNYWKWKPVCQSHLNCHFGVVLCALISPEYTEVKEGNDDSKILSVFHLSSKQECLDRCMFDNRNPPSCLLCRLLMKCNLWVPDCCRRDWTQRTEYR